MIKPFVLFLSLLISCHFAFSKTEKHKPSLRTTEANFSGTTVHGKYAHSPEARITIEKEKKLISVVKPREKFIFQIKKSQEDYK